MVKIDLQRAYDSVEWIFLEKVLEALCFPPKFIQWLMECIHTVHYSILLNGEPTETFDTAKGLRQGDPISPYLFAIAMEYLSRCLHTLKENKDFKFHLKCARLGITHLCFADDLLLFARGDTGSISAMYNCFQIFSQASGLYANVGKSCFYFGGITPTVQNTLLQQIVFGLEIICAAMTPLINKIVARISSWTAKKLSYARRTQLVQSVLFGVQSHWAQLFVIPAAILKASWMVKQIIEVRGVFELQQQLWNQQPVNIRDIYLVLLGDRPRVSWKSLMFANGARPKAIFTLWLQIQNRLMTTDRLTTWGIDVDHNCKPYQGHTETRDHLYIHC
ncbi:uncharacterized protein LOC132620183 [Lycium barbarum]|uniref:uncharacterized protein LOC132620183 n=1 Tax=Lycium barbarum TaxID=112863 RepID=UPI00293ED7ED|nr:uncharacterized protein LOC132620183 [Lycium barbarum]